MNSGYILEIFSGKKIVSSIAESKGYQSISIDNNPRLNPSICCDILNFDPGTLPGKPLFIWASPVCTELSRTAKPEHWEKSTKKYRQYNYLPKTAKAVKSLQMVQKTVDIIEYFYPVPFVIENPVGRIHHLPSLQGLGHYRYFVNYSNFGFPYSKETYLFSNMQLPFSTKKYKVIAPGLVTVRNVAKRSEVPRQLIETIFNYLQ